MRLSFTRLALGLAIAVLPGPAAAAIGVPKADLWPRWQAHARQAVADVDYAPYAAFLARYVRPSADGVNRVAYGRVTPGDKAALKAHLRALQAVDVDRLTRPQQMAYWINLYNAKIVDLVLDAYPVPSIRKVQGGLLGLGPWGRKLLSVKGEAVSLNDVEHRILRPIWRDPRIHYAVNCASLGCPDLAREPFRADRLDAQLDAAARAFVNHPRAFARVDGALTASSIYDWYGVDFGGPAGVLAHARRYADTRTAALLKGATSIEEFRYDWSLNDAR